MVLVAIFAASLTASEAAACSSMKSSGGACAPACGCCSPEANEAPAAQAAVDRPAATPQPLTACEAAPGEGCVCRTDEPAAPTQKPASPTVEGRIEFSQGSDFVQLGDDAAARLKAELKVPPTQSPPKIPLYLRNARLLF